VVEDKYINEAKRLVRHAMGIHGNPEKPLSMDVVMRVAEYIQKADEKAKAANGG
jgi:RNase P protein component